jgi:hypothetical protein
MGRVREYSEALKTFRSRLLVLMHISGEQLARETKLIIVQYKNGPYGDIRELFINNGIIMFVITYNKIMNITAQIKMIHRYLPRKMGELIVYYVWLMIPF